MIGGLTGFFAPLATFAASYPRYLCASVEQGNDFELGYRSAEFEFGSGPLPDLSMTGTGQANPGTAPTDASKDTFFSFRSEPWDSPGFTLRRPLHEK
jgi:hypothetical protein